MEEMRVAISLAAAAISLEVAAVVTSPEIAAVVTSLEVVAVMTFLEVAAVMTFLVAAAAVTSPAEVAAETVIMWTPLFTLLDRLTNVASRSKLSSRTQARVLEIGLPSSMRMPTLTVS